MCSLEKQITSSETAKLEMMEQMWTDEELRIQYSIKD